MKKLIETSCSSFLASNGNMLLWSEDLGIGYLKSNGMDYDGDYWECYQNYRRSNISEPLNNYRLEFVKKRLPPWCSLCDVGVGNGHFVESYPCKGFDVNAKAVAWLKDNDYYADPHTESFDALTFWDVLEHIDDVSSILRTEHVFTSLPIHAGLDDLLRSKHLKPDEHIWHFTERGFIYFMSYYGYKLVDSGDGETRIGREGIMSYYFKQNS